MHYSIVIFKNILKSALLVILKHELWVLILMRASALVI